MALQAATAAAPCTLVEGDVAADGSVSLAALVRRDNEAALRRLAGEAAKGAPVAWRMDVFDVPGGVPYCAALDALRPAAPRFGVAGPQVRLELKTGARQLHKDDNIIPRFVMPNYAGYALVTYITKEGQMAHLYPSGYAKQLDIAIPGRAVQKLRIDGTDNRQFPAGATVTIGDPDTCNCGDPGWKVDPPFGRDLMLIAVSSQPLFTRPRPDEDSVDAYLRDLRAALEGAVRRSDRVNARAILVETAPR